MPEHDKGTAARFAPLDGLRGIAILMVIVTHGFQYRGSSRFGHLLNELGGGGWAGVTLFFVLSGFLISGILLDTKSRPNYLRDFYARRSLRIFPLYFAFLAAYFLIVPRVAYLAEHLPVPTGRAAVFYWLYLTNMLEWLGEPTSEVLGPLWSLAVEEQVYLAWPFLILLIPVGRLPQVFIALGVCSFVWRVVAMGTGASVAFAYNWTPANLESFAIGGLVAWMSRERAAPLIAWAPWVTAGAASFLAGMWTGGGHLSFWFDPALVLTLGVAAHNLLFAGTIALSVTGSEGSWLNRGLSAPPLRWCGKFSYAMYLFHTVILELVTPVVFSPATGLVRGESMVGESLLTVIAMVGSLLAAIVSWYAWEQPFLSLKRFFPLSGHVARPAKTE